MMASTAGLASLLRLFVVVKLCPLWGKSKPCLPKSWQIIANLLPRKDHSRAPFPPLFGRTIARWHRYARIHNPLFVRLPVLIFRQCVSKAPQKQQPREQPMKQRYFSVLIGAGLLVSGSIISGLANANMDDTLQMRGKFMAKKLAINNYGRISLQELTNRQK
jgi:hypothetical protein